MPARTRRSDPVRVQICFGHICARDGRNLECAVRAYVAEHELETVVRIERTSCSGECALGPNVVVHAPGAPELAVRGLAVGDIPRLIGRYLPLPESAAG